MDILKKYTQFLVERFSNDNLPMIEFDATCADITEDEWNRRMKGKRPFSYNTLKKMIKQQYPMLYDELGLDFYNPWQDHTYQTPEYYVLTASATEYFFRKI